MSLYVAAWVGCSAGPASVHTKRGTQGPGPKRTRTSPNRKEGGASEETASSDLKERHEKLNDDVDSILDEIDEVLEENAEEFVRSYIQKGGQ